MSEELLDDHLTEVPDTTGDLKLQYKSVWHFLKCTPRNLAGLIVQWALCLTMIIAAIIKGPESFDPPAWYYFLIVFVSIIGFLGYLRVYLLYLKNKWR